MIRRPPRSTLFPTRRSSDLLVFNFHTKSKFTNASFYSNPVLDKLIDESMHETSLSRRSEEHTSELQSRPHLVCRLLLEKKKLIKFLCLSDSLFDIFNVYPTF